MKPILFNTEMVRAILDGRKVQTRRVLKPKYRENEYGFLVITNLHDGRFVRVEYYDEYEEMTRYMKQPYNTGDVLWVKETWAKYDVSGRIIYRADADGRELAAHYNEHGNREACWRPSIHMPKEAARIFLRVKNVRVEHLKDMTEEAAIAEGLADSVAGTDSPLERFSVLWDKTVKREELSVYGWDANPWVWVIEFERTQEGIVDDIGLDKQIAMDEMLEEKGNDGE